MPQLSWFFDFHTHKSVCVGEAPDPLQVASTLVKHGVSEVTFHAKCHMGYSYYPTKVGTPHPRMKGDVFGMLSQACRAQGLKVFAYVSFGIDGLTARQHPAWMKHFANGPHCWEDWFAYVCPFTPYTQQSILPQVEEILDQYPVDGVWFDTMSAWNPCYCATCRADFKELTGHEIPRTADDPYWPEFGRFRYERGRAVVERITRFIHERRPGLMIAFNQLGSPPFPDAPPVGISRMTLDFQTNAAQSRRASMCAAFGTGTLHEADVIPTIFNGGWGDWTMAPLERQEQIAATVWARRCILNPGDRLHPDVRLTEMSTEVLSHLSKIRNAMAAQLPDESVPRLADVTIIHGETSHYGEDYRHFAVEVRDRLGPLAGMCDLLLDAGANYTLSPEYALQRNLRHTKLVVLPELEAISPQTDTLLRQFTQRGGRVLVVGTRVPLVNGVPMDWLGVTQAGGPWLDHMYLPSLQADGSDSPTLVRGDHHRTEAVTATQVSAVIAPLGVTHGEKNGWGIAPPAKESALCAALTCHHLGHGSAWYLAAPLASDYFKQGNWQQARYAAAMMAMINPEARISVISKYGCVEVVGYGDEHATHVVLVNHSGEQMSSSGDWPRTWGPVVPHDVTVRIAIGRDQKVSQVTLNQKPCTTVDQSQTHLEVSLKLNAIWSVLRVDWSSMPACVAGGSPARQYSQDKRQ